MKCSQERGAFEKIMHIWDVCSADVAQGNAQSALRNSLVVNVVGALL